MLAEDRKYWCKMPTDAEFAVLETLTDVLKPLSYLTDALACEKQVTASAIFPVLKHVKSILTPIDTEKRLAKGMKQLMWSDSQEDVIIPPAKKLKGLAAVSKHIEQEDGCPCSSNTLTPQ